MARGVEGNEVSSSRVRKPKSTPIANQSKNQKTLLGFFQKKSDTPDETKLTTRDCSGPRPSSNGLSKKRSSPESNSFPTPAFSSDALEPSSPLDRASIPNGNRKNGRKDNGLLSPSSSPSGGADGCVPKANSDGLNSSPRRAQKQVNYAETSDDDEDLPVFKSSSTNAANGRAPKRRRVIHDDSDDDFGPIDSENELLDNDEDMGDFIVADASDEENTTKSKKKRSSIQKQKNERASSPVPPLLEDELVLPSESTAQQWRFDPENPRRVSKGPIAKPTDKRGQSKPGKRPKQKAHMSEPEQRYPWLATIKDGDRNAPNDPEYDPRTLYIPPLAWAKFSPFEKQYWEIKQKFWDTIVFFKKGKFYELYENDATIGHQLFDLKLTDRVNMRMVGVPEASLEHWASQFVAKGFKIARVDQMESALGKEMRERDDKVKKEEKVIRRELASILTAGTLVDGGMLQDDMSTFCAAIKEDYRENLPVFGIAFVDTATAQFHITEFEDDASMTKFETFVAQTRPGELLLEKSCLSTKALRILKNNTGPTTIWNSLKPRKEFWEADITCREIDASGYFVSRGDNEHAAWPSALEAAREKDLLMSAVGALIQYLRLLKIERDLVSLGNFSWYDPLQKATSLVLDGQSLINLEVFANSIDGGSEGTLFAMLNRCISPFGKRMLRNWVCHPLVDRSKINARLDAVEALNADPTLVDRFSASLSKIPDLERLISRIHAGRCRAQDFVKVLEGFEQIDYTMSLLGTFGSGDGVIGQLITSMPDIAKPLRHWRDAFDREKARQEGILVPEPGVEQDFDESQEHIEQCLANLDTLLRQARKALGSQAIKFTDNGKEIYQLEVPIKIKGVPKDWDQMSATKQVKRYYSPELRKLVRALQEAQETHGRIVREVAGRFYARFDEDYSTWLAAVKIIAQLDCLISLARASTSLGEPRCRPVFTDEHSNIMKFKDLRHPCMVSAVDDFIPNDVELGGTNPKINLLTGANAAGKSTILRMTCVAVIMAQVGCFVPCSSALLTPADRIMSRLGANDHIFAAQSTFFVELSETKKILSEATPRSLVILDELGRGTSSYDGVAVAQAVLHHIATHVGCLGFFATHYHSLATEFAEHPEITPKRMQIDVDEAQRRVTFLYKLEDGVAEGSFGMHCAAMCGIPDAVIDNANKAAAAWEHTSRLKESLDKARQACYVPLGFQSDLAWMLKEPDEGEVTERGLDVLRRAIAAL